MKLITIHRQSSIEHFPCCPCVLDTLAANWNDLAIVSQKKRKNNYRRIAFICIEIASDRKAFEKPKAKSTKSIHRPPADQTEKQKGGNVPPRKGAITTENVKFPMCKSV